MSGLEDRGPRVGVGVILLTPMGVPFLLRQGSHGAGTWSLAGGAVSTGESLAAAAIRETEEELGVTMTNVRILDTLVTEDIFTDGGGHWITFYAIGQTADTPKIMEPNKASEISYWNTDDPLPKPLFAGLNLLAPKLRFHVASFQWAV